MRKLSIPIFLLVIFILCSCATDLTYNASIGDVGGIKTALAEGQSIEVVLNERTGRTPLLVATYNNRVEAVEYLCQRGANVNAQSIDGSTALHIAAYYNFPRIAKVLLEYNADKNIKDNKHYTALDYAEYYNHGKVMDLLED